MTPEDRLKLVRHLLDSDVACDAERIHDLAVKNKLITHYEKSFAKLIIRLYLAVHPSSGCLNPHKDWEDENERDLKLAD